MNIEIKNSMNGYNMKLATTEGELGKWEMEEVVHSGAQRGNTYTLGRRLRDDEINWECLTSFYLVIHLERSALIGEKKREGNIL